MGCTSAKHVATKEVISSDENKTLLVSNSNSEAKVIDNRRQHLIMQFSTKPASLERIRAGVANAETTSKLSDIKGLVDVVITVSAYDQLSIQFIFASEEDMKSAEANMGSANHELSNFLNMILEFKPVDAPRTKLVARGGNVQLAGHQMWSLSNVGTVKHHLIRVPIKEKSIDSIARHLNGSDAQQRLRRIVGLLDMEVIKESDASILLHCRYVSEAAAQAAEEECQSVLKSMQEFHDGEIGRMSATGGSVQLQGLLAWSFRDSILSQPELPSDSSTQADGAGNDGLGVQEAELLPSSKRASSQSWLFASCCAAP